MANTWGDLTTWGSLDTWWAPGGGSPGAPTTPATVRSLTVATPGVAPTTVATPGVAPLTPTTPATVRSLTVATPGVAPKTVATPGVTVRPALGRIAPLQVHPPQITAN